MIYPFMTLNDNTQIVHSEMKENGEVKVYIERPKKLGFDNATCWLPNYRWENVEGFSEDEMKYFDEFVHSVAHVIIELSQTGGFDNAASL